MYRPTRIIEQCSTLFLGNLQCCVAAPQDKKCGTRLYRELKLQTALCSLKANHTTSRYIQSIILQLWRSLNMMLQVLEVALLSLGNSQQSCCMHSQLCILQYKKQGGTRNEQCLKGSVLALPGSTKEALGRQQRLLFGHGAAHQLVLTSSLIPICRQLHLQPQPVVPLL